jgi:cytochrome o ubiquinol oxidase subunit 1
MYRGRIRFTTPMLWFLGFVFLFTIGGVAGVVLAVPSIDYQLHNSLFLVAHFHMMIVSGVLFGYFAGITYWFPKIFGFKLNERLGRYAFWCWSVGFFVAFIPLYILGFMGATRRLDHYSASTDWQPMFIVAGIGAAIIAVGVAFQILQFIVSVLQRKQTTDFSGDPWDGRTLEWSTVSPAPFYNFAIIPEVTERDAFWAMKHNKAKKAEAIVYQDIEMPKNTAMGMYIAATALALGFGFVWHIWWLVIVSLLAGILTIIIRTNDEHSEYTVPASKVAAMEAEFAARRQRA